VSPPDRAGPRLEVVILDIDGTLVDSNDAHAHAWIDALAEHGIDASYEKVRRLIGKGGDKLLPEVTGIADDTPRGEAIGERRAEIFRERYVPKLAAFPDVRRLLEQIRAHGLRLVVATSAKKDEVEPLLRIANVVDLIDKKTSSDDAESSKPDPDIIAAALKRAGVSADAALMIGDTPYDIEAARSASVDTIAFRSGGWDDEGLKGAIAIYDGASDLLAQLDRSPIGRRVAAASAG
jgi:HAD superfamily hydrolase (TIGR01509 family)